MKCPACTETDLAMTERQNIEIDYCPKCRGVWLDRGELDKIIERSLDQPEVTAPPADPNAGYPQPGGHHGDYGKHGYRRKSWLSHLFD